MSQGLAEQVGYWLAHTEISSTGLDRGDRETPGEPRHYVMTDKGGVIARTMAGVGCFEIAAMRRRWKHARYLGAVTSTPDGWKVTDARGEHIATVAGDYLDAEAVLVLRHSDTRSHGVYCWPQWMLDALVPVETLRKRARAQARAEAAPKCDICGWELPADGQCTRTDLHWTPESLAADALRRSARRDARRMLTLTR